MAVSDLRPNLLLVNVVSLLFSRINSDNIFTLSTGFNALL